VYLTLLSVSGQGAIHLGVQARNGETLAKLEKQLRAAGYGVKPLAVNPGADKFGYSFRSNVELIVPEKMKIELAKVQAPERPADDSSLQSGKRGGAARLERQRAEAPAGKTEQPAVAPKPAVQAAPVKSTPQVNPERPVRDTKAQENRRPYPGYNREGAGGRAGRKRGNE
jgi:hypothetical protein